MKWGIAIALVVAAATAPAAYAQTEIDPAFVPEGVAQWEKGRSRGLDQARHPEFQALAAPVWSQALSDPAALATDPYRLGWDRGTAQAVTIPNRYGTPMRATLFAPKSATRRRGRGRKKAALPAVIALTGGNGPHESLWAHIHGLTEAGYVVLGLDVQGDGKSPADPPDPDPSTPANEYCEPGAWQEPQEMGIRELQPCAGQPPAPATTEENLAFGLEFNQQALTRQHPDFDAFAAGYTPHVARKVLGALDAVQWLLTPANPLRSRIDAERIGIIGHSLGAHGALVAGNGDPLGRFAAVVSLDSFAPLAPYAVPTVPTMFQQHEIDMGIPKHHRPDDTITPAHRGAQAFRAAGVPTMLMTPDAATHQDFNFLHYVPLWAAAATLGTCPDCVPAINASRDGERVSLHYATAWFDRYLKRDRSAESRLLASTFDGSSDRSSIGQGEWDPVSQRNVPYTIGGETVRSHLSPLFRSFADLGTKECEDLREGC